MNRRQKKTLEAVFADPVSATVVWADIESLLWSVGCELIEAPGSGVKFTRGDVVASFHRPHPQKEAKRYQVRAAREYLVKLGVQP